MMSPDTKFGDIATFRNGLNYSRKDFGVGLHVINVGDFGDRLIPNFEALGQINPADVAGDKDLLLDGDLLFVRSNGNPALVGRVLIIRDAPFEVGHSGFCIRARLNPDVALPEFYQYYFRCQPNRERLVSGGVGANIVNVSQNTLQRFNVPVPALNLQEKIVEVLSSYDQLININRRRISLLNESARLLYRQWFVDRRVHSSSKVENGATLPKHWYLGNVGGLASLVSRGITPQYDEAASGLVINQKCIRGGRLTLAEARKQSKEVKADRQLQVGDVLINSTGAGTLGRVAQVRTAMPDCTVDTHVTIVRPSDPNSAAFLGVALLEQEAVLATMGVGSTNQLELPRADIASIELVVPPEQLRAKFQELVWPIFMQAETLAKSNEGLVEARDALLPKIMSGELVV